MEAFVVGLGLISSFSSRFGIFSSVVEPGISEFLSVHRCTLHFMFKTKNSAPSVATKNNLKIEITLHL